MKRLSRRRATVRCDVAIIKWLQYPISRDAEKPAINVELLSGTRCGWERKEERCETRAKKRKLNGKLRRLSTRKNP